MLDGKYKTTIIKLSHQRGITDLLPEYAYHGNSQGDESTSCLVSDYIASDGWMSCIFKDINPLDQKAINERIKQNRSLNELEIKRLKNEGKYGEEYTEEIEISYIPVPQFDEVNTSIKPESYRMTILDFSNDKTN